MRHPDSSLAAYVEGTATARERATAEGHLASCAVCRKEIARARKARTALATLPEVDAPGVDVAAVVQRAEALRARAATKAPAPAAAAPQPTEARRARPIADGEVVAPAPFEEALARAQSARVEAGGRRATAVPAAPAPVKEGASVTELPAEGERVRRKRERDRAWQLRVVQGALGAAAVLVAIVLFVGLRNPPPAGTARDQAAEVGAGPQTSPPATLGRAAREFDAGTFQAYAEDLAEEVRTNDASLAAEQERAIPATPKAGQDATEEDVAIACLNRETELVGGTHLYSLEQATFDGRPVYVGAFLSGLDSDQPSLLVIAASIDGCEVVQLAEQPL